MLQKSERIDPTLLAAHPPHRSLLDQRLAPAALAQAVLDPLVAIGSLLLSAFAFGAGFQGPYLILALIVFSLTFPGTPPKGISLRGLAGDSCLSVGRRGRSAPLTRASSSPGYSQRRSLCSPHGR